MIKTKWKWIMTGLILTSILTNLLFFNFLQKTSSANLFKNISNINNITLPENPFFISSNERVSPYNGIGSLNLNKITIPYNQNSTNTQIFFNISVTDSNTDKLLKTSDNCYTSKIYYFISKNTFPDLSQFDNRFDNNQTIYPVQHARFTF